MFNKKKKRIYMDNAASTYVSGEVLQAMLPYFTSDYGNASSLHSFGRDAEKALSTAREKIAKAINADPSEIFFTSGATEANNWMLRGVARQHPSKRVIVSAIEHPSILDTCKSMVEEGYKVDYVKVDQDGIIQVADLLAKLAKPAALVSIMAANNEVGTIQYINTIANICKERGVPFHSDATQAIGSVFINVKEMNIDALSLSAHKIYGPKGIGALYIKNGIKVDRLIRGGAQERNRRAGTSNVSAAVGFGVAMDIAIRDSSINNARLKSLRDYMITQIEQNIENVRLNGHRSQRLPNNVHFSFHGIEGEALLMLLDFEGIAVSTGSACSSGSLKGSHVMQAMGLGNHAHGSIRFSLGRNTTKQDIDFVVAKTKEAVKKLRAISTIK